MRYNAINFMDNRQIGRDLQLRVLKYIEYIHDIENDSPDKGLSVINQISKNLKTQIYHDYYGEKLLKEKQFSLNFSKESILKLTLKIKERLYGPGEVIFEQEEQDYRLYFLIKGECEFYQQNKGGSKSSEYKTISQSSVSKFFGYKGFISGIPREMSCRSVNISHVFIIARQDLIEVLKEDPQDYEKFCTLRDQYLLYTNSLGEQCFGCKNFGHTLSGCPQIHLIRNKELIIFRDNFSEHQKRVRQVRNQKSKYLTLTNRANTSYQAQRYRLKVVVELRKAQFQDESHQVGDIILENETTDKKFSKMYPYVNHYLKAVTIIQGVKFKSNEMSLCDNYSFDEMSDESEDESDFSSSDSSSSQSCETISEEDDQSEDHDTLNEGKNEESQEDKLQSSQSDTHSQSSITDKVEAKNFGQQLKRYNKPSIKFEDTNQIRKVSSSYSISQEFNKKATLKQDSKVDLHKNYNKQVKYDDTQYKNENNNMNQDGNVSINSDNNQNIHEDEDEIKQVKQDNDTYIPLVDYEYQDKQNTSAMQESSSSRLMKKARSKTHMIQESDNFQFINNLHHNSQNYIHGSQNNINGSQHNNIKLHRNVTSILKSKDEQLPIVDESTKLSKVRINSKTMVQKSNTLRHQNRQTTDSPKFSRQSTKRMSEAATKKLTPMNSLRGIQRNYSRVDHIDEYKDHDQEDKVDFLIRDLQPFKHNKSMSSLPLSQMKLLKSLSMMKQSPDGQKLSLRQLTEKERELILNQQKKDSALKIYEKQNQQLHQIILNMMASNNNNNNNSNNNSINKRSRSLAVTNRESEVTNYDSNNGHLAIMDSSPQVGRLTLSSMNQTTIIDTNPEQAYLQELFIFDFDSVKEFKNYFPHNNAINVCQSFKQFQEKKKKLGKFMFQKLKLERIFINNFSTKLALTPKEKAKQ